MTCHFTITRIAIVKGIITYVAEYVEKLKHIYAANGNVNWFSCFGKHSNNSLKSQNIQLLYEPEILLLGIYPREIKTYVHTKNVYMNFHSNIIHKSPKVETTQCLSTDEGRNKIFKFIQWCII